MTWDEQGQWLHLRGTWAKRAAALRDEAIASVRQAIHEDLQNQYLRESPHDPTDWIMRAVSIALGLSDGDSHYIAGHAFEQISAELSGIQHREEVEDPTLLVPLVLQGASLVRMNDFDGGIARITFAADTAEKTSGSTDALTRTWIREHLEENFEGPGSWLYSGSAGYPHWVAKPEQHVHKAMDLLGPRKYAAMAAIQTIFRVAALHYAFPSEYTRMRLLDAYRGLAVSTEALAKSIGKVSDRTDVATFFNTERSLTLYKSLNKLLAGSDFWQQAENMISRIGGANVDATEPVASFVDKMTYLLDLRTTVTSFPPLLSQSLVGSLLLRGLATHHTSFEGALTDERLHRLASEHALNTFVYLPYMCHQAGHLEKFYDD